MIEIFQPFMLLTRIDFLYLQVISVSSFGRNSCSENPYKLFPNPVKSYFTGLNAFLGKTIFIISATV